MKSQISLYALLVFSLTVLGLLWSFPAWERQEAAPVFPATIHRDCGPGKKSAFTISIPIAKSVVGISIYQPPDLKVPATFLFPDDSEQVGNALLIVPASWPEILSGDVSFQRVEPGSPVVGDFDLVTELGKELKGRFIAEWNKRTTVCG